MRVDPYLIKRLPRSNPKRIGFTIWARWADYSSRLYYAEYELPKKFQGNLPNEPSLALEDTQVVPAQAQYLLWALRESGNEGCIVEVGAWRGVTTELLARNTTARVIAIDPWIGHHNEMNLVVFQNRAGVLANVAMERKAFGQAVREWTHGRARFIFIDAAHDYANVAHDLAAARQLIRSGGIIALHDTDNAAYPGCRRAVYEVAEQFEVVAHVSNLTIFRA